MAKNEEEKLSVLYEKLKTMRNLSESKEAVELIGIMMDIVSILKNEDKQLGFHAGANNTK